MLDYGLVVWAAGLPALAVAGATLSAESRAGDVGARVRSTVLWMIAALAVLLAAAAAAGTAETLNLRYIVMAQANTHVYLLLQPVAAAVFLVALVLAAQDAPLRALLGPRGRARLAVEIMLAAGAGMLGALLFLGGDTGPLLPGWLWLVLKSAAVVGAVALARRPFRPLTEGARLAIGWSACLVGFANLVATVIRAAP